MCEFSLIEKASNLNKAICAIYPNTKSEGVDFTIADLLAAYDECPKEYWLFDVIMWDLYNIHYRDFMIFTLGKHAVDLEALELAIEENLLAFSSK
jgi:hypothetical protein